MIPIKDLSKRNMQHISYKETDGKYTHNTIFFFALI